MARNSRKIQIEVENLLKKVREEMNDFDELFQKCLECDGGPRRERMQSELKRELGKLQRRNHEIKHLLSTSDVRDTDALNDAVSKIQTAMGEFWELERGTKTKAFSNRALASTTKHRTVTDQATEEVENWIVSTLDSLRIQREEAEFTVERDLTSINSGGGKKGKKAAQTEKMLAEVTLRKDCLVNRSTYHTTKLEQILRLLRNQDLEPYAITVIKDEIDGYVASLEIGDDLNPDWRDTDELTYDSFDLPEVHVGATDELLDDEEEEEEAAAGTENVDGLGVGGRRDSETAAAGADSPTSEEAPTPENESPTKTSKKKEKKKTADLNAAARSEPSAATAPPQPSAWSARPLVPPKEGEEEKAANARQQQSPLSYSTPRTPPSSASSPAEPPVSKPPAAAAALPPAAAPATATVTVTPAEQPSLESLVAGGGAAAPTLGGGNAVPPAAAPKSVWGRPVDVRASSAAIAAEKAANAPSLDSLVTDEQSGGGSPAAAAGGKKKEKEKEKATVTKKVLGGASTPRPHEQQQSPAKHQQHQRLQDSENILSAATNGTRPTAAAAAAPTATHVAPPAPAANGGGFSTGFIFNTDIFGGGAATLQAENDKPTDADSTTKPSVDGSIFSAADQQTSEPPAPTPEKEIQPHSTATSWNTTTATSPQASAPAAADDAAPGSAVKTATSSTGGESTDVHFTESSWASLLEELNDGTSQRQAGGGTAVGGKGGNPEGKAASTWDSHESSSMWGLSGDSKWAPATATAAVPATAPKTPPSSASTPSSNNFKTHIFWDTCSIRPTKSGSNTARVFTTITARLKEEGFFVKPALTNSVAFLDEEDPALCDSLALLHVTPSQVTAKRRGKTIVDEVRQEIKEGIANKTVQKFVFVTNSALYPEIFVSCVEKRIPFCVVHCSAGASSNAAVFDFWCSDRGLVVNLSSLLSEGVVEVPSDADHVDPLPEGYLEEEERLEAEELSKSNSSPTAMNAAGGGDGSAFFLPTGEYSNLSADAKEWKAPSGAAAASLAVAAASAGSSTAPSTRRGHPGYKEEHFDPSLPSAVGRGGGSGGAGGGGAAWGSTSGGGGGPQSSSGWGQQPGPMRSPGAGPTGSQPPMYGYAGARPSASGGGVAPWGASAGHPAAGMSHHHHHHSTASAHGMWAGGTTFLPGSGPARLSPQTHIPQHMRR